MCVVLEVSTVSLKSFCSNNTTELVSKAIEFEDAESTTVLNSKTCSRQNCTVCIVVFMRSRTECLCTFVLCPLTYIPVIDCRVIMVESPSFILEFNSRY